MDIAVPRTIERRREPRYAIESCAYVESNGTGRAATGRIMDISDHGMRVEVNEMPWHLGDTVWIRVQDELIRAKVRHFRTEGTLCTIGVELDERINSGQMQAVMLESSNSPDKWTRL